MYDIIVTTHFDATHCLRGYPEDFEVPHKHQWKVAVTVKATELDELGMGIDFLVLDKHLKAVVSVIDSQDLNELAVFRHINPSTEFIAKYIFDNIEGALQNDRYRLYSVGIAETETSAVVYYGEQLTCFS